MAASGPKPPPPPYSGAIKSIKADLKSIANPTFSGSQQHVDLMKKRLVDDDDSFFKKHFERLTAEEKAAVAAVAANPPTPAVPAQPAVPLGNLNEEKFRQLYKNPPPRNAANNTPDTKIFDELKTKVDSFKTALETKLGDLFDTSKTAEEVEREWGELFKNQLAEVKKDFDTEEKRIKDVYPPPVNAADPDHKLADRESALNELKILNDHMKTQIEAQRDNLLTDLTQHKFTNSANIPVAPPIAVGKNMNLRLPEEELDLSEQARTLRMSTVKDKFKYTIRDGIIYDNKELVAFQSLQEHGLQKNVMYSTNTLGQPNYTYARWLTGIEFSIEKDNSLKIDSFGVLTPSLLTGLKENCSILIKAYMAHTAQEAGVLNIQARVSLKVVKAFADAIQENNGKPALTLSDESIKHLIKSSTNGWKTKTAEGLQKEYKKIALQSLRLQGKKPDDLGFDADLAKELTRVISLSTAQAYEKQAKPRVDEAKSPAGMRHK